MGAGMYDTREDMDWTTRFVRALSLRGNSNAPRPALFVPYLAVNTYEVQGRQARSGQKNVFWAVLSSFSLDLNL